MTVTNNIYQKQIKYHVFNAVTNSELTELVPVFTMPLANQKKELLLAAIFVGKRNETKKLYRGPYIDASCQVWLHKIFSSETAWPNGAKLGRKHLCKVLYKVSSFNSIGTLANQKQELLLAAIFVGQTERNEETL
jgi:hypothetical protein